MLAFVGTQNFYGAAVQVIPVLALVQIVERGRGDSRLPASLETVLLWAMVAAVATGEMVGFRILYWGGGARTDQWYVIAALVVAGVAALAPTLWGPSVQLWHERERWHARAAIGIILVAVVWLVFAFLAVLRR